MNELIDSLHQIYNEYFPHSLLTSRPGVISYTDHRFLKMYLGASRDEMVNKIYENDPLSASMSIAPAGNEFEVESKAVIHGLEPDNPYMVYSSRKIRTRKFRGNAEAVKRNFRKLVERIYAEFSDIEAKGQLKIGVPYSLTDKLKK